MLHRLPPDLSTNEMPLLNEIQPDLHPSEVLFDVAKLLQPQTVRFTRHLINMLADQLIDVGRRASL